jgi:diguanylate cyclase (GGDEF)-like protein
LILDIRTMGILSAVTPFVLGFVMLAYQRERKVYRGFRHWLVANFGMGIGFALLSLRGFIPAFSSIVLGNVIFVYCLNLVYEGIEIFFDRPRISRFNYLILGLYTVLQIYFTFLMPDENARIAMVSLVSCIVILRTAERLLSGSIPKLRNTCRSAAYAMIFTAIFPFLRGLHYLLLNGPVSLLSDALSSWFSPIIMVSMIIWTFYFFLLNSARLELDLETVRAELDQLARTDPLTSLYNRRHFNEHALLEFQRAIRYGYPLSLMVLDLDNLKTINDRYGHAAGDMVLASLSEGIRLHIRPFDILARMGGDEFSILFVDTNEEDAYSIASRICDFVSQTPVMYNSYSLNISVSAGVSTVISADNDLQWVLERTDRAMYQAKQRGKNCVVIA